MPSFSFSDIGGDGNGYQRRVDLLIVIFGVVASRFLEEIAADLRQFLPGIRIEAAFNQRLKIPESAYLPIRKQHLAAELIEDLKYRVFPTRCLIGITRVDLCADGLKFVFGQAELGGRLAVISSFRFQTDPSGNEGLTLLRTQKTARHEVGHNLGYGHCPNEHCVMHFSNVAEDTDRKGPGLCKECHAELEKRISAKFGLVNSVLI